MTCPNCSAAVAPDDRFCSNCGASLTRRCESCGEELRPGSEFCASCGTPVRVTGPTVEHRLVTSLYVDLVGSTGLAETLDPEDLATVVNAVHETVRAEVGAHQGAVGAFVGDGVLGVFGLPDSHEDDPVRALRAATAILERVTEIRDTLGPRLDADIQVRIGVNTGELLAPVGEEADLGTLAGDVLNVAARLQELATPGGIVVAEPTARSAPRFRFDDMGLVDVRGRARPLRAFTVIGESEGAVQPLKAPMVGREREHRDLQGAYHRVVAEGRPHLLTVLGNAGVGKSRLVREFLDWAGRTDSNLTTLTGRCLPYGQDITYRPLTEIITELTGVTSTFDPEEAQTKIASLVRRFIPDNEVEAATTALARMIGLDVEIDRQLVPPARTRELLRGTWRAILSGLAGDGPVIVLVEDIHWAGEGLLDVLEHVVRRGDGPLLVVCPTRPELVENHPAWASTVGSAASLPIDPLDEGDSIHLATRLLADAGLPVVRAPGITERADGNPLFIEELVRQLADRGDEGTAELPATIQGVVSARIDLLDQQDRRALQAASVMGRIFWPSAIAHMTEMTETDVHDALGRLESLQLVRVNLGSATPEEVEYLFQHVLIREAAYARLSRPDLAQMHWALAEWLEVRSGDRPETAERAAYHTYRAHQNASATTELEAADIAALRAAAVRRLVAAASNARARAAFDRSLEVSKAAFEIAEGPHELAAVQEQLGLTYLWGYDGDAAWDALKRAVDHHLETEEPNREAVANLAAYAVQTPARWSGTMRQVPSMGEILKYLNIGIEHAGTSDSVALSSLLTALSFMPMLPGQQGAEAREIVSIDEAREAGRRAREIARRIGIPYAESAALDALNQHALWGGRVQEAVEVVEERIQIAEVADDPAEIGDAYAMAAWLSYDLGEVSLTLERAERGYQRVLDEAPSMAVHCLTWAAQAQLETGDWKGLGTSLRRAKDLLSPENRQRPPFYASSAFGAAAMVAEFRGKSEEADRLMEMLTKVWKASDLADRGGHPHARWTRHLGPIYIRRGDFETAAELVVSVDAEPIGRENDRLIVTSELVAARKAWEEADAVVEEMRATSAAYGLRGLVGHADRLEGQASLAARDRRGGLALLSAARDRFEALGSHWEAARTDLEIAAAGGSADIAARLSFFKKIGAVEEAAQASALLDPAVDSA